MMKFYPNKYHHFYNRSNNREYVFRFHDNYLFFLKKYRYMMDSVFDTVAYCLMPTHFHFWVRVKVEDTTQINPKIGTMVSPQ